MITVSIGLQGALGRGDGIRFARVGFDRLAQGAGDRFKGRFGDMVAVEPVQRVDMQGDAAVGAECLEELTHQFGVECADAAGGEIHVPDQEGPRREVERSGFARRPSPIGKTRSGGCRVCRRALGSVLGPA